MTDRELIELAAKAAGATPYGGPDDCSPPGLKFHADLVLHYEGAGQFGYEWNPLIDDGDALRLAATLFVSIRHMAYLAPKAHYVETGFGGEYMFAEAACGDAAAATRRAITRAAAEIGRAK